MSESPFDDLRYRIQHGYFDFHGGDGDPDEALLLGLVDRVERLESVLRELIDEAESLDDGVAADMAVGPWPENKVIARAKRVLDGSE